MSFGGWLEPRPIDGDMQDIAETKTKKSYEEFVPVLYRSQRVSGINILAKVIKDDFSYHIPQKIYLFILKGLQLTSPSATQSADNGCTMSDFN
uniref:Uncharacterized protein n=1 Tax=Cyprinodon variegatus TaxID=28743 RepID=A0A3Q2D865_CYPVA